jgi:formylglycine-generating enzyme required for sulfatase activity
LIVLALWSAFLPAATSAAGYNLLIAPAGKNTVAISWPAAATNYALQSTLNLAAPNWQMVTAPAAVLANNTNTVTYTNDFSVTRFFRLILTTPGYYLTIARSGTNFVVSWPAAATNYVLQSALNLSAPNWQTVTVPATQTLNNTNFVTYTNDFSVTRFFRLYLNTNTTVSYTGMVLIPAGTFTMGNSLVIGSVTTNDPDITDANPVSVTVSAFYMDTNLVSYSLWQSVYNAAVSAGYTFVNSGSGKGPSNPVESVDWYDTVKWCNARSQQAGLAPVYYTDAGFTQVYTNGQTDAVYVNWSANGYRLPTEAEWEKAARGGLTGKRFPLGNTISETMANYYVDTNDYSYDLGPINGYDYLFNFGGQPYTSPVGYFPPNGYGLYDMAGNEAEWCWDWYGTPYAGGTDPRGPVSGSSRMLRGGDWSYTADSLRCANRGPYSNLINLSPGTALPGYFSFRSVRGH